MHDLRSLLEEMGEHTCIAPEVQQYPFLAQSVDDGLLSLWNWMGIGRRNVFIEPAREKSLFLNSLNSTTAEYVLGWMNYTQTQLQTTANGGNVPSSHQDTGNFLSAFPFMHESSAECQVSPTLLNSNGGIDCIGSWLSGTPAYGKSSFVMRQILGMFLILGVLEVAWTVFETTLRPLLIRAKPRWLNWWFFQLFYLIFFSWLFLAFLRVRETLEENAENWPTQLMFSAGWTTIGVQLAGFVVVFFAVQIKLYYSALLSVAHLYLRWWTLMLLIYSASNILRFATYISLSHTIVVIIVITIGAIWPYVLLILYWEGCEGLRNRFVIDARKALSNACNCLWWIVRYGVDAMVADETSLFCVLFPLSLSFGLEQAGIGRFHWLQLSIHFLFCCSKRLSKESMRRTMVLRIPFRVFCISRFAFLLVAAYKPNLAMNVLETVLSYLWNPIDNLCLGALGPLTPSIDKLNIPVPLAGFLVFAFVCSAFMLSLQLAPTKTFRILLIGGAKGINFAFYEWALVLFLRYYFPAPGQAKAALTVTVIGFMGIAPKRALPWIFPVNVDTLCHSGNDNLLGSVSKTLWDSLLWQTVFLGIVNFARTAQCESYSWRRSYAFPLLWLTAPLVICSVLMCYRNSYLKEHALSTDSWHERFQQSAGVNDHGQQRQSRGHFGVRRRNSMMSVPTGNR